MYFSANTPLNGEFFFAGLTLAELPLVILYLMLSEQFIKGLTAGAVKG